MYTAEYLAPLGTYTIACTDDHVCGVWAKGQKYDQATLAPRSVVDPTAPMIRQTITWLDRYFAGEEPDITELPLKPEGSGFRQAVWEILCQIPYGQYRTYGDIAAELAANSDRPMSAQAVGGAVGHNPISIIIPCHRVVGSAGSLTGYAAGTEAKLWLLRHENVDMSGLKIPGN